MGFRNIVKKSFTAGFQPMRWLGMDLVRSNGKICADLVKDLFEKKPQASTDVKLIADMSETDLTSRKKIALGLGIFYLVISLSLVGYAFYLWLEKVFILQGAMSLILAFLVSTYSLRELLIYGQIRSRRDRLTLKEWFSLLIKGFPK